MAVKADISTEADRLMQCLGLLTHEPIFAIGTLTMQMDRSFIFPPGGDVLFYGMWPAPRQFQGVNLDADKCTELQEL